MEPVATNPSLWDTLKAISPFISSVLNVVVLLVVYIWTNKSKDDDRFKSNIAELPTKIKEEIKEWVELKEVYSVSCITEHTRKIGEVYTLIAAIGTKVSEVDKLASRVNDRVDACEKRCDIIRKASCKDD